MTKKRFKINYDDGLIRLVKDNITKNNLDIIDCCSALNELSKENKELKEEVENLIEDLRDACNYIEEKNKEIKKLNETINNLITKNKR